MDPEKWNLQNSYETLQNYWDCESGVEFILSVAWCTNVSLWNYKWMTGKGWHELIGYLDERLK